MSGSITQLVTELTPAAVAERMARHLPRLEAITSRYPVKRAALLPALWLAQEEFGWVPRTAIAWAAERCGVAPVHAFGLVEFHSLYRQGPRRWSLTWRRPSASAPGRPPPTASSACCALNAWPCAAPASA
jgi:hypothetical protein